MNDLVRPEDIEPKHVHDARGSMLLRWPVGLGGLAILLGSTFFDVFGSDAKLVGAGEGVELVVEGPGRIRNGNIFEITVAASAEREIGDLVLLVGEDLWRKVTVNTLLPEPAEAGFRDGAYEFRFGPVGAGEDFLIKINAQVNPDHLPSTNSGSVALADGNSVLAVVDYTMEVIP